MYKSVVISFYVVIGAAIVLFPLAAELRTAALHAGRSRKTPVAISSPAAASLSSWARGYAIGLLLSVKLVWWDYIATPLFNLRFDLYLVIVLVCAFALFHEIRAGDSKRATRKTAVIVLVIAAAAAAPVSFSTGFLDLPPHKFTAWHHWSAYVGPSELLLSGARIFFDFPAQYGFGPTVSIALACGDNCWVGMYVVSAVMAFVFAVLGCALVVKLGPRTIPATVVMVAACLIAFMLWTASPEIVSNTLTMPSGSALRFLPAVTLVFLLVWSERQSFLRRNWIALGTLCFTAAALWSPESLFISTLIWAPYFLLRRLDASEPGNRLRSLVAGTGFLLATGIVVAGVALIAYRSLYGIWPDPEALFGYILYPPGPMPIDPRGPVLFSIGMFAVGGASCAYAYRANGNTPEFRRSMIFLLLAYGTFAYVLGRGHGNNFCNLVPYAVLVLSDVVVRSAPLVVRGAAGGMLASVIGLTAFFGWNSWHTTISRGAFLAFEPRAATATWSYVFPDTAEQLREECAMQCTPADAVRALRQIRSSSPDPAMILSNEHLSLPATTSLAWSAMHAPLNYEYFPSELRRRFLRRSMRRFERSGWMLFAKTLPSFWRDDFEAAYDIVEELDFGAFRAVHFTPKGP